MTDDHDRGRGILLPEGASASTALHALLDDARASFPDVFAGLSMPADAKALKATFPTFLARFEQRRVASPRRGEVAAHIAGAVQERFRFVPGEGSGGAAGPLTALGARGAAPFPLVGPGDRGAAGWAPRCSYRGQAYAGADLAHLVDDLEARHRASPDALGTLRRALRRLDSDGRLDLDGERFALLGAGAEIAPTRALVEAGAEVLWTDVRPPEHELATMPGKLSHANGRGDLLTAPDRVAASVRAFAEGGGGRPVHLGLFAYGPGRGREWRLGAAMNAIVAALPREAIRSVALYVSPTSPAVVSGADRVEANRRFETRPFWQRTLLATGAIQRSRIDPDLPRVSDTIVGLQGMSYQAAQWVEKTLAAEALRSARPDLRVSSNVAPVTETRSLEHPLFRAAFRGAPIFGVESVAPEVTRTLCALMMVEDLLGEAPEGPRHLHGGLFALPYALDGAIRIAALRGLASEVR